MGQLSHKDQRRENIRHRLTIVVIVSIYVVPIIGFCFGLKAAGIPGAIMVVALLLLEAVNAQR